MVVGVIAAGVSVPVVKAADTGANMTFVVELPKKEQNFVDSVKADEKLYENLKGIYLGEVTDVRVEPYIALSPDLGAQKRKETAVSGLYNVYLQ